MNRHADISSSFLFHTDKGLVLIHHGVKGMKWGVRKEYEPKGRTTRYEGATARIIMRKTLTTAGGILLPGIGGLAVDTIYRVALRSFPSKKYVDKTLAAVAAEQVSKLSELPRKADQNNTDDLKLSNPNYMKRNEYMVNCTNCVMAYEMRCRGFDVEAAPLFQGRMTGSTGNFLKNFKIESVGRSANAVLSKALTWGDGSRGVVEVQYPMGAGHIFNVEVANGKAKLVDPQIGKGVNYSKFTQKGLTASDFKIGRTDNLSLENKAVTTVIPRKGK